MDDLFEGLVASEEANFSLFNYVNDLSGEVDKLEEGIGSLRCASSTAALGPCCHVACLCMRCSPRHWCRAEVERYRSETTAAAGDSCAQQLHALSLDLAAVEDQVRLAANLRQPL